MVRRLRVACLQLNPQRYAVERNLRRADALLEGYDSKGIDLLVLPEMAMTGYMFESRTDIEPYLECASEAQGPTLQWASKTASRLGSHVLVGYPERSGTRAFNSAALFDHTGQLAYNYRKHFLYDQDYKWSDEGEAFGLLQLHDSKIPTACIGICMDLSPKKFEAPFNAFEFATHCVEKRVTLVLVTMAWLSQSQEVATTTMRAEPTEPELATVKYWALRMSPLMRTDHETVVVACNRCGIEGSTVFAGSSSILRFPGSTGSTITHDSLGWATEGVLLRDIDIPVIQ